MGRRILEVPRVEQKPLLCGPASLSMGLKFNGLEVSQDDLAKLVNEIYKYEVDDPTREDPGMDYWQLVTLVPRYGLIGQAHYNLCFEDVVDFINNDMPVISRHTGKAGEWAHFIVIKGYDTSTSTIFVNDPGRSDITSYQYDKFKELWDVSWHRYPTVNYGVTIRQPAQK